VKKEYQRIIMSVKEYGSILDAMLALQEEEGYLTEEAVHALAEAYGMFPAQVYETGSFYGMLRFKKPEGQVDIRICRGAPCHVSGAPAVIDAVEKELGITIGQVTEDGRFYFGYMECQGQCQAAPSLLVDGQLYTDMTPQKAVELIQLKRNEMERREQV